MLQREKDKVGDLGGWGCSVAHSPTLQIHLSLTFTPIVSRQLVATVLPLPSSIAPGQLVRDEI